jgi:hypothetical protein
MTVPYQPPSLPLCESLVFRIQVLSLKEQVKTEEAAVYESRRVVLYDSTVLLQHVPSGLYLCMTGNRALAPSAMKMTVGERNQQAAFVIHPGTSDLAHLKPAMIPQTPLFTGYKCHTKGDTVQKGHAVKFYNEIQQSYIHVSADVQSGGTYNC